MSPQPSATTADACLVPFHYPSPSPNPQARDKKIAQDPAAASTYGRTAKHLNIAALSLGIVGTIILIVVLAVYYNNLRVRSYL